MRRRSMTTGPAADLATTTAAAQPECARKPSATLKFLLDNLARLAILKHKLYYLERTNHIMQEPSVVHNTFVLERSYPVAPERVFAALSNPAKKRRWFLEGGGTDVEG